MNKFYGRVAFGGAMEVQSQVQHIGILLIFWLPINISILANADRKLHAILLKPVS